MFYLPMLKFTKEQWERLDDAFDLQGVTKICIYLVPTIIMAAATGIENSGDSIVAMIDENGPEMLLERGMDYQRGHCLPGNLVGPRSFRCFPCPNHSGSSAPLAS